MRVVAPDGRLSTKAVGSVLRDACDRAGVPRVGSHRLRHTVATDLLAAGASLSEIAPVLRHTNLSSTAVYAKVDRAALRTLASVAIVGSVDMSTLAVAAADYLRVRRALGYKLGRQGRQLLQFVAYLDRVGASTITIEHAVAWATQPTGGECGYWADRLSVVRQFARYLQTIDPACEVPPKRLLPCRAATDPLPI